MVVRAHQRGYTLIELMVALVILALTVAVAAPLGRGWTDSVAVRQATHSLLTGMARAKAVALSNANTVSGTTPAAILMWTGSTLCVYGSTAPTTFSCTSTSPSPVWQASAKATILLNGALSSAQSQCVALNNRATAVALTIGSVTCGTTLTYAISYGTQTYPTTGTYSLY
jgi:prepilin-type N-terminal cleavage/methylation domain-containing protein